VQGFKLNQTERREAKSVNRGADLPGPACVSFDRGSGNHGLIYIHMYTVHIPHSWWWCAGLVDVMGCSVPTPAPPFPLTSVLAGYNVDYGGRVRTWCSGGCTRVGYTCVIVCVYLCCVVLWVLSF